jgi:hypothetical protein
VDGEATPGVVTPAATVDWAPPAAVSRRRFSSSIAASSTGDMGSGGGIFFRNPGSSGVIPSTVGWTTPATDGRACAWTTAMGLRAMSSESIYFAAPPRTSITSRTRSSSNAVPSTLFTAMIAP